MSAVELIRQVCKEKGISIAKLERECDFSNGYLGKLKKGTLPVEKAVKVSEYLGIDLKLLIGMEIEQPHEYYINKETAKIAQEIFDDPDKRVLFEAAEDCKPEYLRIASDMLRRLKETNPDG